ncbi:MAG: FAD-dependent monooxygenase [Devosia sp.]
MSRFGRVIDKKASDQYGILYDDLVAAVRGAVPPSVDRWFVKANGIKTSDDRQQITLSDGETISARLVVLANGLNNGLRDELDLSRVVLSQAHSATIAFNLRPRKGGAFPFPALTFYAESTAARMAYLTLFPVRGGMRANLMIYRKLDDPWVRRMLETPETAMFELMPSLKRIIGEVEIETPVKIRPADLTISAGFRQPGVVLVGDAFATSCPAAGTGVDKVFTDVDLLCKTYIPAWLKTPGMGADKIGQFYDDAVKRACDTRTIDQAYALRALSIDPSPIWVWRRWRRFLGRGAIGLLRRWRSRWAPSSTPAHGSQPAADIR